jgi:FtsP/CotA-like multicopper oxidase with cupredoxin domain
MTTHFRPLPRLTPPDPSAVRLRPVLPLALCAAALTAACAGPGGAGAGGSLAAPFASAASPGWREPVQIRSVNGILDVTMEVTVATLPVPTTSGTKNETLRTYRLLAANGISYADSNKIGFPGPTFRVSRGDSVRILLINNLPADATEDCEQYPAEQPNRGRPPRDSLPNCFHGPNSTNIHFHGFHVSPDSGADNVLMQIAPGDRFQYAFRIPQNQSPGTHWYHPHKHGSVALQVTNGMSGAFIVEGGGLDELTRAWGMREVLVAVQEIDPNVNLVDNTIPRAKLVNGLLQPTIPMAPNEVLRMRLVNENVAGTATYQLVFSNKPGKDEPQLFDVARDGVQYAPENYSPSRPDTGVWVAPGNRLDMFVRAPADTGTHELLAQVVHVGTRSRKRRQDPNLPLATQQAVFRVRVTHDAAPAGYPTHLPPALPPLPGFLANLPGPLNPAAIDTSTLPVIVFSDSAPPFPNSPSDTFPPNRTQGNPSTFWLGNAVTPFMRFSSSVFVPTTSRGRQERMVLGGLQTWMVVNRGTTANHPFHIHINPFQVIDVVYGPTDPNAPLYAQLDSAAQVRGKPIWMDVVPLPLPYTDAARNVQPGYVIIRQQYENFTGRYVMHCHILGHEERGMMQLLQVDSTATGTAAGAAGGHPHRH